MIDGRKDEPLYRSRFVKIGLREAAVRTHGAEHYVSERGGVYAFAADRNSKSASEGASRCGGPTSGVWTVKDEFFAALVILVRQSPPKIVEQLSFFRISRFPSVPSLFLHLNFRDQPIINDLAASSATTPVLWGSRRRVFFDWLAP